MLRIDRVTTEGTQPLGVWTNFPIHGTVIGPDNDLYDADCHGAAERYLEAAIRSRHALADSELVIHALTSGTAGDAAPAFLRQVRGSAEAERLGRQIAVSALDLFRRLDDSLSEIIQIQRAYREISLRNTLASTGGAELSPPQLGFPVMGGTEDGYSLLHFLWPGAEGSRAKAADVEVGGIGFALLAGPLSWNGEDSAKVLAAAGLHDHLLPELGFPRLMTLQTMRVGGLLLVAIPGEITTKMGLAVARKCSSAASAFPEVRHSAIVSLANQYMSYFTTPTEYNAQHYEGAHSIWGQHAGEFIADELSALVEQMANRQAVTPPEHWTFSPGNYHQFAAWQSADRSPLLVDTVLIDTSLQGKERMSVFWWDQAADHLDFTTFHWRIEVQDEEGSWQIHRTAGITEGIGLPVDDTGLEFIIRVCSTAETRDVVHLPSHIKSSDRKNRTLWRIVWIPREPPPARFRFAMYSYPDGQLIIAQEVSTTDSDNSSDQDAGR
jgi:neutral ceramidase